MTERENRLCIILTSNDLDRVWAALILANGAAASGMGVTMFFAFWGLSILRKEKGPKVAKSFLGRMFGLLLPRGTRRLSLSKFNFAGAGPAIMNYIARKQHVASPGELLKTAREFGVRFIACEMSMDMLGLTREELIDGAELGGVATCPGRFQPRQGDALL